MRYFRLSYLFMKISLMRSMAYRPHFFTMILGKVIRIFLLFFFFQAVFLQVDRIGGWSFKGVLLLFATFHLVDFLMSITFQRNLSFALPRKVQNGELDWRMILPANLLFLLSFEDLDMMDFFSAVPAVGFLGYVLYLFDFSFSWAHIFAYAFLLFCALVFLFSLILILATLSFWTTQSYGLGRIFDDLLKIGRYPLDIFEGFWKVFFVYFLPLVIIAQVPSQVLMGTLSFKFVFFSFCLAVGSMIGSLIFWRAGLRNYSSAST